MFSYRVKRFQRFLIPLGFLVVFMGAAPVAEIRLERKVVGPGGVETEDIGVRLSPEKLEFYKWLNLGEPGALVVNAGIYSTGGQWELDGIHGTAGGFDIGGTLSAQAATISGNLTLSGHLQPSTTSLWNLGSSSKRWVTVYAMAVDTPSDRRLKRDIEDLDYGLEELMKMRPVSYQWKEHPEKGRQLGLIAQDLQQIVPEVVSEVDDAQKSLSVEYMALIPVLIASLQEQNHRNGAVATVAAGSGN